MPETEVAYLGPPGTYSHLVAVKRFGAGSRLVPFSTVHDICAYVSKKRERVGVVPIENSSGGAIYETVDILLENEIKLHVLEELALNVNLALLGRQNETIRVLYSHFAPLEHCATWIKKDLPSVEKRIVASTAAAAVHAASEQGAAALGNRRLARLYNLEVLHYPVQADVPNLTTFLAIAGEAHKLERCRKTTLAAKLPNEPGSLVTFLEKFRDANVNLSRLISRPLRGCPREYMFLVDIEGDAASRQVKGALKAARSVATDVRLVGTYPTRAAYKS